MLYARPNVLSCDVYGPKTGPDRRGDGPHYPHNLNKLGSERRQYHGGYLKGRASGYTQWPPNPCRCPAIERWLHAGAARTVAGPPTTTINPPTLGATVVAYRVALLLGSRGQELRQRHVLDTHRRLGRGGRRGRLGPQRRHQLHWQVMEVLLGRGTHGSARGFVHHGQHVHLSLTLSLYLVKEAGLLKRAIF